MPDRPRAPADADPGEADAAEHEHEHGHEHGSAAPHGAVTSPGTPGPEISDPAGSELTTPLGDGSTAIIEHSQIGRFQVTRALGAGGMGVVFEAEDPELERRVAIKVLHLGDGSHADIRRGRLLREARAAARLTHPNIITIHDVGTLAEGHPFVAMELVDGETLAQWQTRAHPWREVVARYLEAARGLAAAHAAGLVHRDFKPHNVLLGPQGVVRVTDFGIAAVSYATDGPPSGGGPGGGGAITGSERRAASGSGSDRADRSSARSSGPPSESSSGPPSGTGDGAAAPSRNAAGRTGNAGGAAARSASDLRVRSASAAASDQLTAEGEILGTPAFMAPEQRAAATVDARADQYAFCVALHQALTGEFPFGEEPTQRAQRAAAGQLLTPRGGRPGPRRLHALIERGLAPRPDDRFPSMDVVIVELERLLARRRWMLAALAAGAIAAAFALTAGWPQRRPPACQGGTAELAETWGPTTQHQLAAAYARSGLPEAEGVAARTGAAISRWGADWSSAYDDACRATRVNHVADEAALARRVECLTSAREVLRGIVSSLVTANRELAGKSPELVLGLPRLRDCVTPPVASSPGPDPVQRQRLRQRLDAADAAYTIGQFAAAITTAQEVLAAARAASDRELETLALLRLGRVQRRRGELVSAAATLFDAAVAAEGLRRDDLAAESWAEWIFVRGGQDVDAATLADGIRRGRAALARAGNPPFLRALLLTNEGAAAFLRGDSAAADPLYREALALRERMYGANDPRVADLLDNVATNLDRWARSFEGSVAERKRAEARALSERALAIRETELGKDHPAVARSLQNLSGIVDQLGKREVARAMLRRALAIKEQALGKDHVELASTINQLADFDEQEGRLEAALAGYQRSLELQARATGPASSQIGFALRAVAEVQDALDRPDQAAAAFRRLAAVRTRPAEQQSAVVRAVLAEVAAGAPLAPARQELDGVIAAQREALAPDDPRRAPALLAATRLDVLARAARPAAARLAQVTQILAADREATPANRAEVAMTGAELALLRGDAAAAQALARQATALCDARACETDGYAIARRAAKVH